MVRHVIIGTAGHVDHGKTTLIHALTGTNTDRLAEEKARGMTIDLGFAFLSLPGDVEAGIVDVPGHERFVKNMLAGAGGVDVALLVVAADEGPMPQTREHLDILTILGVERGVIALSKTDLADPELRELAQETTREALAGTPLAGAPIVPVSAQTGEGIEALKNALALVAASVPPRDANAPFRLPLDRVFSLPGVGTIVTGTLVEGTLQTGDVISVQPQNLSTKARTLQTHNQRVDTAQPGMRIAVNVPGIDAQQIERGAVLCPPGALAPTSLLDVRLALLQSARPLRHRERVRVHLGTGEILARLLLLEGDEVTPGSADVPVQLLCESTGAPTRGERFVVRTYSPARAVAGGIVLDPHPARRHRRGDAAALALFEARNKTDDLENNVYAALAARHEDFSAPEIAAALGADPTLITVALESLADEGRAVALANNRFVSDVAAGRLRDTARRTLAAYHQQNPLRRALPREGLRVPLAKAATVRDFNAAVAFLLADGVCVVEGAGGLRLPDHVVVMPPRWQQAAADILAAYQGGGLQPPSPDNFQANLPRDVHVPSILNILAENNQLVRIADDLYIETSAFEKAKSAIRGLADSPEGITVGSVRDVLGSSRKIVLPLLEYLDAQRFTRRLGDKRVLA